MKTNKRTDRTNLKIAGSLRAIDMSNAAARVSPSFVACLLLGLAGLQITCAVAGPISIAASPPNPFVAYVIKTTTDSCYAIGDDTARLKAFAETEGWAVPSPEMLRKFARPSYKLINGWTFEAHNRAFAVQQTENANDRSRSCSITTKLNSQKEYEEFKSAWDSNFVVKRHEDRSTPTRLFHFDAMTRPPSTSISTTLSLDRNAHIFSILVSALPHPQRETAGPSGRTFERVNAQARGLPWRSGDSRMKGFGHCAKGPCMRRVDWGANKPPVDAGYANKRDRRRPASRSTHVHGLGCVWSGPH